MKPAARGEFVSRHDVSVYVLEDSFPLWLRIALILRQLTGESRSRVYFTIFMLFNETQNATTASCRGELTGFT